MLSTCSKDVRLPVQLQRAMAAEAEAAREARAKVIAAEGEQKASRALKEAAEVIAESPAALQVIGRPPDTRTSISILISIESELIQWKLRTNESYILWILQLRYLQTLNTISAEKNSTIIFPLPIDILKHFLKPKNQGDTKGWTWWGTKKQMKNAILNTSREKSSKESANNKKIKKQIKKMNESHLPLPSNH